MRNTLKFLATTLVAALLVCAISITASAATTKFTDVDDKNETLSEAVALLAHLNVTKGTTETTFGTNENVTRQQMAAFIYRLVKQGRSLEGASNSTAFTDLVDPAYNGYISWANQTGVIKGISTTEFNPTGGITLQDAYTMVVRALEYDEEELELVYPFSYIDIAEDENVALDRNLPSSLDYTSVLTRGDVAVILYNAFFAETGAQVEIHRVRTIGEGTGNERKVIETITEHPTFAEHVYDVEVGEFVVRATPKYCFNDSINDTTYKPLCDMFEEDNLHLVAVEEGEPVSQFYAEYDKLGLTGKADDHIMTTVKVYYTYETKNDSKVVDELYFASNQLQTIETNEAKVAYKTVKDSDDYLTGTSSADPEGYLTVAGEKIYFFNAPYSYIKPNYSVADTEDERYWLRNEKDVKFIDITRLDSEKNTFCYYLTSAVADTPEEFAVTLARVLCMGVYKLKFYDVDGDDIYEYLHYMPATFGKMVDDEDMVFADVMDKGNSSLRETATGNVTSRDIEKVPTIYYRDAILKGESFFDGDFVIAYINPAANIIDVQAVITPYRGYISSRRPENGVFTVDGKKFSIAYSYRVVENLYGGSNTEKTPLSLGYHGSADVSNYFSKLTEIDSIGEEFEFYVYNCELYKRYTRENHVLYYKHVGGKAMDFASDNLIIAVEDEENKSNGDFWTESRFNGDLGERLHYTKVWLGGEETFVPLNTEDVYPEYDYLDGRFKISVDDPKNPNVKAYLDKIATYEVDSDGRYIIKPFLHSYNAHGDYIGVNRDATTLVKDDNFEQFGNDFGYDIGGVIKKFSSTRYQLLDESGYSLLGDVDNGPVIDYFVLTKNSMIIIKNTDTSDGTHEYLTYDMSDFGGSTKDGVVLTNIQYVLKGDPDSTTRAELLVLYAEADNFEFAEKQSKDGYRIVSSYTVGVDAEGDYRNYYTLLNPFTGSVETDVPGNEAASRASALKDVYAVGSVVEVKGNEVDEDNDNLGKIDTSDDENGLVWITEYDSAENYIAVVPTAAVSSACCLDTLTDAVETYTYSSEDKNFDGKPFIVADGSDMLYYEIDEETTITVLTSDKPGDKAIKSGEYSLGDVSIIASASKEYKCYNDKYLADEKSDYKRGYAPFLKAYVIAKEAKDTKDMPIAEHIIIVVNGNDATALLNKKCKTGHNG